MPVPGDLLKALAEDPKALEQQLGCMTGLFQIFDRQGLGRRYGSKRVSNAASGQSQPTSACETPRYDHSNNPYWMIEDDSSQISSADNFNRPKGSAVGSTRSHHHHRAYSDSSEVFTKSCETPTESRTSPDEKSQVDNSPIYSEESVGGLAFYFNDQARNSTINSATSNHPNYDLTSECKKLNVVIPSRTDSEATRNGSNIRDIVRASLDRDNRDRRGALSSREQPRLSVDERHSQRCMKNLPRSSSVDGKDRTRLSVDGRLDSEVVRLKPADLPRSSSVGGRGAVRMLADWKDGLRSTGGSPRLTIKEKDSLKHQSLEVISKNSVSKTATEGRDATRLTVELEEGPRLSLSADDRRASVNAKMLVSPRPIRHCKETSDFPLVTPEFKDSLRDAEIKEFLRTPQKIGSREGHRFSVDGTRDAPRACVAPRLSVDGRDSGNSSTFVLRKLKLGELDRLELADNIENGQFNRQTSGRVSVDCCNRPKASNVVARLMGLDELPRSKDLPVGVNGVSRRSATTETDLLSHEFSRVHPLIGGSPPPPPSPSDDYDYAYHSSDHGHFQGHSRRIATAVHHSLRPIDDSHSQRQPPLSNSKHQYFEQESPKIKVQNITKPSNMKTPEDHAARISRQSFQTESNDSKLRDAERDLKESHQVRKSPQGRRSLWHIFEAMQLKGVFNTSSRRKNSEALKLQSLKVTEEKECQVTRARSQSVPPLLSSSNYLDCQDTPRASHVSTTPRLPELKGSVHGQTQKSSTSGADEEAPVVVKPIITRSVSYKTQATPSAAPNQPYAMMLNKTDKGMSNPDDEISPRNICSSLIENAHNKKATVDKLSPTAKPQEPSKVTDPLISSPSLGQAKKERSAARMSKSLLDAQQSGRDSSSPRGPRATTSTQEKVSRSCSPQPDSATSVSPRCSTGRQEHVNRPVDAGKVRKKAFAVKEVETKASLANLRANATKQEFLKGRASGNPDTPRPLRRISSESKLLSKIAQKPTAADIPAPTPPGGKAPSNMKLRSKRLVSKDNSSSVKNSSTCLDVKVKISSAKDDSVQAHVIRLPTVCDSVPNMATSSQEQKIRVPLGRSSLLETVRDTEGGALDHSGDTANPNARPHGTESKAAEIDEIVKTPRGVSTKKIDFLEDVQAEVADQPSPVSVLDNFHFYEELTPSPKAGKSSVAGLQDQNGPKKDRIWNTARFLDLDLEEASPTALLKTPDEDGFLSETKGSLPVDTYAQVQEKKIFMRTKDLELPNWLRICCRDADEERMYVKELLETSEVARGCATRNFLYSSTGYILDTDVFDQLETKRRFLENDEQDILDRRVLFESVNEVLKGILETQLRSMQWMGLFKPSLTKMSRGTKLLKEVLSELGDLPCAALEDDYETVQVILRKDLDRGRGLQWLDYNIELEKICGRVEKMIMKDLIEETVKELNACIWQNPLEIAESSRRQLFA